MTVVVGTAGHIDHGKTALLRALTGIDADRLPEERRRGMTIDVGYAHLGLADGTEVDFVDVPGHDRLIGNMLVGAGEMDAVMLVVAADDGPRAQTIEHLELLDALGIEHGIAVVTKVDVTDADRIAEVRAAVTRLLVGTSLAGSPVLAASSVSGQGIVEVREALEALRDRVVAGDPSVRRDSARTGTSRLAVDRTFSVKGRGLVVTGTLRGGPLARNATLRLVPGGAVGRARELQVHGRTVVVAGPGRAAINIAGIEPDGVHRGAVLTDDPAVVATDRLLVRLSRPLPDGTRTRVHLGTTSIDGVIGRSGRDAIDLDRGEAAAVVRLSGPVAASPGDRFVLRLGAAADRPIGGVVLDTVPPRGISRRRQTSERSANLVAAVDARDDRAIERARLDLHGALDVSGSIALADDVAESVAADTLSAVVAIAPIEGRHTLAEVRAGAARALRRLATVRRDDAAVAAERLIQRLIDDERLARDGEYVGLPGTDRLTGDADPALRLAMDRLARSLAVTSPPPLGMAARETGCPETGIRELVREGRIILLERDLAYEAETYRALEVRALDLARQSPLTPAALRDATSTSRKYVMAILADLDRREILRRTEPGHVPGPRAASVVAVRPVGGPRSTGRRPMTDRRVSAIVLAGGRSSRFGRDKLAEPIGGRTLLQHAIDVVRPFATEIIVVAALDRSPVVEGDVRLVHDPSPFEGPLVGLAAGLDGAREATVFLTAGDTPELMPAVAELLLNALDDPAVEIAVLGDGDSPQPFPMALRRDVARATTARLVASGERRLFPLIDALACTVIDEPAWRALDPEGRSMRDIDTPADLP